jgi:hypothetical protein
MQFRAFSALAVLTVSSALHAQDLGKKIDYTTKAITFLQAFSQISKQAGVGLFPESDMANEIIILRLKGTPLQDAMQKIADAVGAQWVKKSDGFELDRTPEMENRLRQEAIDSRVKLLEAALGKQTQAVEADKPLSQDRIDKLAAKIIQQSSQPQDVDHNWREILQMRDSLPDQLAILRVFSMIDLRELATMDDNERWVFSNKPTKMQRQIAGDLSSIATRLKEEHNAFLATYSKLKAPDKADPYITISEQEMTWVPDRFVLSVTRQMFGDSLKLNMIVFDSGNHAICSASTNLSIDFQMEGMIAQRAKIARDTATEKDIPVSAVTNQMLEYVRKTRSNSGSFEEPITGELRQALLNPEQQDPLSYAASEAFLGIAEARNENLVVYPDDTMFLVAMLSGMEGSFKPSLVMQAVSGFGQVLPTTITETNGWMTLTPADRLATLQSRMSREALGSYLREQEQNGCVSIDSTAKLASAVNGCQLPVLAIFVPMMLDPSARLGTNNDLTLLKIYSTLNSTQIQQLESHAGVPIGDLTSGQLLLLNHLVFASFGNEQMPVETQNGATESEVKAASELTETMPDGLPIDTVLNMSSNSEKTYFCQVKSNNSTFTESMSVDTMAWYVNQTDHPDGNVKMEIVSIQPGESRTLSFSVVAGAGRGITTTLNEQRKGTGGPWTLAQLPDDLKAQLAKAKERFDQARSQQGTEAPAETLPAATAPPPNPHA